MTPEESVANDDYGINREMMKGLLAEA